MDGALVGARGRLFLHSSLPITCQMLVLLKMATH